jgi:hypothetical protein
MVRRGERALQPDDADAAGARPASAMDRCGASTSTPGRSFCLHRGKSERRSHCRDPNIRRARIDIGVAVDLQKIWRSLNDRRRRLILVALRSSFAGFGVANSLTTDHHVAEHENVHVRAQETIERFLGLADDRLILIEGGI